MNARLPSRPLGSTLTTSSIGFGGGAISGEGGGYGFGALSEKQAIELLQGAFERGVTLFDTAPIYGFGTSEKRIGLALSGNASLRKELTIVTKLGVTWDADKKVRVDNSRDVTLRMLDQSLKDLRTDYVDLYMIHWPDPRTPLEETMKTLSRCKEEGRIKAIGACNFDPASLARAQSVAPVDVIQNQFSLLMQEPKDALFPLCKAEGKGFMAYGPLAKGLLAGTVSSDRTFDAFDFRGKGDKIKKQYEAVRAQLDEIGRCAKRMGVGMGQLSVAWALSHPELSVALCGSKSLAQLQEMLDAAQLTLPQDIKASLDALARAATPLFAKES